MKNSFYCRSGVGQNPVKTTIYWMLVFTSMTILIAFCGDSAKQIARLPDDAVILAFGDSLTSGTGAKKNESNPGRLG